VTPERHLRWVRSRSEVLTRHTQATADLRYELNEALQDAYRAGLTLRELSEASGLSTETVRKVVGSQWMRDQSEAMRLRGARES
jgi:DNA-directed RNA polymerase specialized sigma24 family protein